MYQPKVTQTQAYADSQGQHVVVRAILLFVFKEETSLWYNPTVGNIWLEEYPNEEVYAANGFRQVAPVIISKTEEIKHLDYVVFDSKIYKVIQTDVYNIKLDNDRIVERDRCFKILALPEQFSDKHMQAIDAEKLTMNEVLVKCEFNGMQTKITERTSTSVVGGLVESYKIHLNQQNHITLFPARQSLEEAANAYMGDDVCRDYQKEAFIAGAEWAKKNNY